MNTKQNNKLASYLATEAALAAIPEVDRVPGLSAELEVFRTKMGEMQNLLQTQQEAVAGKRARRDELLAEMAEAAVDVATLVAAYADKQKLTELAHLVRVGPGDFTRTRQAARPVLARSVLDAAHAVLPALASYGVTAQMVENLQARISAALEGLHQPRSGFVERKTATERLAALFDEIDALLKAQIDRLVYPIRKTHPDAYASYRSAREIIDRSARGPTAATAATARQQGPRVASPAVRPANSERRSRDPSEGSVGEAPSVPATVLVAVQSTSEKRAA